MSINLFCISYQLEAVYFKLLKRRFQNLWGGIFSQFTNKNAKTAFFQWEHPPKMYFSNQEGGKKSRRQIPPMQMQTMSKDSERHLHTKEKLNNSIHVFRKPKG